MKSKTIATGLLSWLVFMLATPAGAVPQ